MGGHNGDYFRFEGKEGRKEMAKGRDSHSHSHLHTHTHSYKHEHKHKHKHKHGITSCGAWKWKGAKSSFFRQRNGNIAWCKSSMHWAVSRYAIPLFLGHAQPDQKKRVCLVWSGQVWSNKNHEQNKSLIKLNSHDSDQRCETFFFFPLALAILGYSIQHIEQRAIMTI